MEIIQRFSTQNPYYKNNVNNIDSRYTAFHKNGPLGLMLHSVGCSQPNAKVFADGWNNPNKEVAVHAVLQADGVVYQCLPWNYRGIHAGGEANNTYVGVEMTEPAEIKYTSGSSFKILDKEAAIKQCRGTYKTAVDLFAYLCKAYNLNPMKNIISHSEGYKKGIASNHGDPEHLWKGLGLGYTMDTFRADVKTRLEVLNAADKPSASPAADVVSAPMVKSAEPLEKRYRYLKDVTEPSYRPVIDDLMTKGLLKGKGGSGDDTVIDLGEDSIRLLTILHRAGVFNTAT